jgi:hypothetical protein
VLGGTDQVRLVVWAGVDTAARFVGATGAAGVLADTTVDIDEAFPDVSTDSTP